MPGPNNTSSISFQGATLRIRESTDPSPRPLLLIHGLTGDENSMWIFAHDLPARYWLMAPRAPYVSQMEQGGYSWLDSRPEREDLPSLEQLKPAAEGLLTLVEAYADSVGLDVRTFDVIGFSQGAAMASLLAFLYPQRIGKAGLLAGFVPSGLDQLAAQRPLDGKPFFVAHGTKDQRVPIDRARHSIEVLERAGANVTYCEDEVGHKVSLTCLRALKEFLSDPRSTPRGGRVD